MGVADLPTLAEVQASRRGKPLPVTPPRVVDRIVQKAALALKERLCRRAVKIRDHGHCVVPRCRKATEHYHHLVYRSQGGKWQTQNIVSLCANHHQFVHAKLLTIRGNADTGLSFTGKL